jgi:hypothetical protein
MNILNPQHLIPLSIPPPLSMPLPRTARLIVILEGGLDVRFLKRVSRILHDDDPRIPDLRTLEQFGTLVFIPIGGSNFCHWTQRLAGLGIPELFILDREIEPLTTERHLAVAAINSRSGCRALLTTKRMLENYLHPAAICEARGINVTFGDRDDVPDLVARSLLERAGGPAWSGLPSRGRRRLRQQAKNWLNTVAVERMTTKRLESRDPAHEVRSWLLTMAMMAEGWRIDR